MLFSLRDLVELSPDVLGQIDELDDLVLIRRTHRGNLSPCHRGQAKQKREVFEIRSGQMHRPWQRRLHAWRVAPRAHDNLYEAMSNPRPMDHRVDSALDLVQKQRQLVATTKAGSPAHRQASEVLALIEESHFLLSELRRVSALPAATAAVGPAAPSRKGPSVRRRRMPFEVVAVFVAALIVAAALWELADPAPMNLRASELRLQAK